MAKKAGKKRPRAVVAAAPRWWITPAIALGLVALVWIVFGQTLCFGFTNYDDNYYVYQNPGIYDGFTRAGLVAAFTRSLVGNWHPLTSISLMLDGQLFHLNPSGYHFVNVLLHTVGVLLLFFVLRAMTGALWRSAFVAALFAIHPLRAESVVWISERKDVLSGVFFFLALGAYHRYARKPSLTGYLSVALAFTLGLLSKAMLVTFPFLLLLLDFWPLRRRASLPESDSAEPRPSPTVSWLILEKIPLIVLAGAISLATYLSQETALKAAQDWPLRWRVDNALVTVWIYLRQMIWPTGLAIFYPHAKGTLSLWLVILALVSLLAVSVAVFVRRKQSPWLFTGWFWYLGMLVPVIGLVQVGWQAHADRYTYLPQIGIYLLIAWGVAKWSAAWRARRLFLGGVAALILVSLATVACRQTSYWSDNVRLWSHVLAVTTNNDVAHRGIGTALAKIGRAKEAIAHDRAALRIRPGDPNGLTNLANALWQNNELVEAIARYREVVRIRPNDSEVRRNLGKALLKSGATEAGIAAFREALRIRPDDADAAYSLGNALLDQGKAEEAITFFRQALALQKNNVAAHYNLAIALSRQDQLDPAIAEFQETLRLQPRHADAHNNLAIALRKKGRVQEAVEQWRQALAIQPANAELHHNLAVALLQQNQLGAAVAEWQETLRLQPNKIATQLSLAWILATSPAAEIRDGARALDLAQRAAQVSGERNLMVFRVIAAAYAETGRFPLAVQTAQDGVQRAEAQAQPAIAGMLQGDLELYEQGVPLRDPTNGGSRPESP